MRQREGRKEESNGKEPARRKSLLFGLERALNFFDVCDLFGVIFVLDEIHLTVQQRGKTTEYRGFETRTKEEK
jgi:hypothetical protein